MLSCGVQRRCIRNIESSSEEWQQCTIKLLMKVQENAEGLTISILEFETVVFSYSGADIYAKDQSLCTPVLTAAAHNRKEAFHCLMKLMDLNDHLRNPIFQVLHVKKHRAETLKVSCYDLKISVTWLLLSLNLSFNSFLLLTRSGDPN